MSIARTDSIANLQNRLDSLKQERRKIVMEDYKQDISTFAKESIVRDYKVNGKVEKVANNALLPQVLIGTFGLIGMSGAKNLKQLGIGALLTAGAIAATGFVSNAINHYEDLPYGEQSNHKYDIAYKTSSINRQIDETERMLKELQGE